MPRQDKTRQAKNHTTQNTRQDKPITTQNKTKHENARQYKTNQ